MSSTLKKWKVSHANTYEIQCCCRAMVLLSRICQDGIAEEHLQISDNCSQYSYSFYHQSESKEESILGNVVAAFTLEKKLRNLRISSRLQNILHIVFERVQMINYSVARLS